MVQTGPALKFRHQNSRSFSSEDNRAASDPSSRVSEGLAKIIGLFMNNERATTDRILAVIQRQSRDSDINRGDTVFSRADITKITGMGFFKTMLHEQTVFHAFGIKMATSGRPGILATAEFMDMKTVLTWRNIHKPALDMKSAVRRLT